MNRPTSRVQRPGEMKCRVCCLNPALLRIYFQRACEIANERRPHIVAP